VLTSTLAALAADTLLSGAPFKAAGLRLVIITAMLLGAASGALLLRGGPAQVLVVAAGLLLILTVSYVVADG
jgi:hypothetical protein